MSTGLTSKTGTVTSFVELSEYVNTTVATFSPSTSVIRPLSFSTLLIGCGWSLGIVTLLITLFDSVVGTIPCAVASFAALIETSGIDETVIVCSFVTVAPAASVVVYVKV